MKTESEREKGTSGIHKQDEGRKQAKKTPHYDLHKQNKSATTEIKSSTNHHSRSIKTAH